MRFPDEGCQKPKHVAVDCCHVYVLVCASLMNVNNLVTFHFSLHMNIFLHCMIINLVSLNKYIYICYFFVITYFRVSVTYSSVFQSVQPLEETSILLAQKNGCP